MKTFHVMFAGALFLLLAMSSLGQDIAFPERPNVSKGTWVVDEAHLIAAPELAEINSVASQLMKEEQVPLLVVTIDSLMAKDAGHFTIERYAGALFDSWGIGSERRNYGMLLLVSNGDHKARIELGKAWAGQHDADAQKIMQTLIIPQFRQGKFSEGILAGVRGMDSMARGLQLPKPKQPWWALPLFALSIVAIIGVIVSLFRSGRKGWGWALIVGLGVLLIFMLRASARSGGGAFGGGSSGGGGATGSW